MWRRRRTPQESQTQALPSFRYINRSNQAQPFRMMPDPFEVLANLIVLPLAAHQLLGKTNIAGWRVEHTVGNRTKNRLEYRKEYKREYRLEYRTKNRMECRMKNVVWRIQNMGLAKHLNFSKLQTRIQRCRCEALLFHSASHALKKRQSGVCFEVRLFSGFGPTPSIPQSALTQGCLPKCSQSPRNTYISETTNTYYYCSTRKGSYFEGLLVEDVWSHRKIKLVEAFYAYVHANGSGDAFEFRELV